jgi:3'-phosphoadenosine 5'-phosphosulfate sulfotransferase (PAPS reductase)/FAD synthetase
VTFVASYSGGMSSYLAAKRIVVEHGPKAVTLLFADTSEEDLDLYRFVIQGAAKLGCQLVCLRRDGGMDALIDEHHAIPSNMMPFCSQELKVELCDQWISANAPGATIIYGIGWWEAHRVAKIEKRWPNNPIVAPLTKSPYITQGEIWAEVEADGIEVPRLYKEGSEHNNCGGACVRGGHASWAHTFRIRPELFQKWVEREERISRLHGQTFSILKDRRGNETKPLPLSQLRSDIQNGTIPMELLEGCHGGCGCFSDDVQEPA